MLIILGGLPGTGKSTLARALARRLGAMWLRIDSIEQAMADATGRRVIDDQGYRVAHAVAIDNLRLGLCVIADSVNPLAVSRDDWRAVALRAGVAFVEVEVLCSDRAEHRRRVETRQSDVPGLVPPTWPQVEGREYHPWTRERVVVDTAGRGTEECVAQIMAALPREEGRSPLG